jgi:hypothetical protein
LIRAPQPGRIDEHFAKSSTLTKSGKRSKRREVIIPKKAQKKGPLTGHGVNDLAEEEVRWEVTKEDTGV